jgi:hypothetical protein
LHNLKMAIIRRKRSDGGFSLMEMALELVAIAAESRKISSRGEPSLHLSDDPCFPRRDTINCPHVRVPRAIGPFEPGL